MTYALLAKDERTAALNALASHLIHQIRNPLAAIQAACSNLRAELPDADHRQRLDLALDEIECLLRSVSSTLHAVGEATERARQIDINCELQEVSDIISASRQSAPNIEVSGQTVHGTLPRNRLRVVAYSLLDHLIRVCSARSVRIDLNQKDDRLLINFSGWSDSPQEHTVAQDRWIPELSTGTGVMGLMVAERFARDVGGWLGRSVPGDASIMLTLNLPCQPV